MSPLEAKEILTLYRPGTADAEDPAVIEAMAVAREDAELKEWFARHQAFQSAMRDGFRGIPAPDHLKIALLTRQKPVQPALWRRPTFWWTSAVAAVALLAAIVAYQFTPPTPDRFTDYQSRMVATVLRQYRMDVLTQDMPHLREFLTAGGAPANYALPAGLARLQLTGGGLLRWRNHPVSMVCFDRGDREMLYLFVLKRSALKDPPPETVRMGRIKDFVAASWSSGDITYVLAGPPEADFEKKYL